MWYIRSHRQGRRLDVAFDGRGGPPPQQLDDWGGHAFGRQPRRPSHPGQMSAEELDRRAGVVNRRGLYAGRHQNPAK